MFTPKAAFSGFSVDDLDKAKAFYGETLGLKLTDDFGGMRIALPNGAEAWAYVKPDHQPASYTMLNFIVDNIDQAVDELVGRGVTFEKYDGMHQDEKGIARGKEQGKGPNIAWFTDPAGNILALIETA
jgi:catechol 2,3-dioxygenase-like lactoylglutathione lyase family enzyme